MKKTCKVMLTIGISLLVISSIIFNSVIISKDLKLHKKIAVITEEKNILEEEKVQLEEKVMVLEGEIINKDNEIIELKEQITDLKKK